MMIKKSVCCFLFNFVFISIFLSQSDEDALRYSRNGISGSARSIAMGGTFGAMGADISCLNSNPAGLGIYKSSDLTITGGMRFANVKSVYNDSTCRDFSNDFVLPNIGIAGAGIDKKNGETDFIRSNFAISLNRTINFKNNISVAGNGHGSSMAQAFAAAAQGKTPDTLDHFYEYWPYYTDLIDTVNGVNTLYVSTIPKSSNNKQDFTGIEGGGISELSMGGGYSWSDKIYAGWALAVPMLKFTRSTVYTETCDELYQTPNSSYKISSFSQKEELVTKGTGINAKFGFIYRFNETVRIGLALQTPTAYSMKDNYSASYGINYNGIAGFDTIERGQFRYSLFTPGKATASVSVLLQKAYAINFDLESVNFGNMTLKSQPNEFIYIDKLIRQVYKQTINFKLGFERNVKPVIMRAGYALFGSPAGNFFSGKLVRHVVSCGLGYKKDNFYIDLAYSLNLRKENFYLYNSLYVNPAAMRYSSGFLLLTVGKKI